MRKLSLLILILAGCASVPSSADIDFKYKTYRIDVETGEFVRGTQVCVKTGIFGKCKEYQYQIIERQQNTKEFREKLRAAQFVLMALPDLLPAVP